MTEPTPPAICGTRHESYPDTVCTEPPGHRMPHGGPLIIGGRECGGAAWGPDDGYANTPPTPVPHACDNCEGIDPASCLANPDWQQPDNPDATALARHIADQPISVVQAACRLLGMRLNLRVQDTTAPVADPALVQRAARALAERYAHGNPGSGMMDHFIAADSYPSMAPVTPNDAASVVLAELAPELAELLDYRNRTAWETTCGEHARLLDACRHADERTEQAEAALERVRRVAGWAVNGWSDLTPEKALRALDGAQPTADTPKEPTT